MPDQESQSREGPSLTGQDWLDLMQKQLTFVQTQTTGDRRYLHDLAKLTIGFFTAIFLVVGFVFAWFVPSTMRDLRSDAKKTAVEFTKESLAEAFRAPHIRLLIEEAAEKEVKKVAEIKLKQMGDKEFVKIEGMAASAIARIEPLVSQAKQSLGSIQKLELQSRAQAHDRFAFDKLLDLAKADRFYANVVDQIDLKYRQYAYFSAEEDPFNIGLKLPRTTNMAEFVQNLGSSDLGTRLSALSAARRNLPDTPELYQALLKHLDSEQDLRGLALAIGALRIRVARPNAPGVLDVAGIKKLWAEKQPFKR